MKSDRKSLRTRRAKFVEAFCRNGGNASQAAIEAGYSKRTAGTQGYRLFKDDQIQAAIKARQAQLRQIDRLTTEDVLRSIARTVLFDPRKLVDPVTGNPRAVHELDEDTALAIQGVEFGPTGSVKFRASDRAAAREQAAKIMGLYREPTEPPALPNAPRELTLDHVRRYLYLAAKVHHETVDSGENKD